MSQPYDYLAVAGSMNQLASPFALDKPSDFKAVTGLAKRTYYKMVEDGKASQRTLATLAASWSRHFHPMEWEDFLPVTVSSDTISRILKDRKLPPAKTYREAERLCKERFDEVVRGNWGASMLKSRGPKRFMKECLRPLKPLFAENAQVVLWQHELAALATVTETPEALLTQGGAYRDSSRWLHDEGLKQLYERLSQRFSPQAGVLETDAAGQQVSATMTTCQAVCATAQLNNPATLGLAYEQLAWLHSQYTVRDKEGRGGWPYLVADQADVNGVADPLIEAWAVLAASLLARQAGVSFHHDYPEAASRLKQWMTSGSLLLANTFQDREGGFCRWLPTRPNAADRSMSIVATLALANAAESDTMDAGARQVVRKSVRKAICWFGDSWNVEDTRGAVYLGRLAQEAYLFAWLLDADHRKRLKGLLTKRERDTLQSALQQAGVRLVTKLSRRFPRFEENPATEQRHLAGVEGAIESTKHHALPWSFLAVEFMQRTESIAKIPCEPVQLNRLKRLAVQRLHEACLTGGADELIERDGIHPICETVYCFAAHP